MNPEHQAETPFSARLKTWRRSARLRQRDAAEKLGIGRSYLAELESGRPPGLALMARFEQLERQQKIDSGELKADTPPAQLDAILRKIIYIEQHGTPDQLRALDAVLDAFAGRAAGASDPGSQDSPS